MPFTSAYSSFRSGDLVSAILCPCPRTAPADAEHSKVTSATVINCGFVVMLHPFCYRGSLLGRLRMQVFLGRTLVYGPAPLAPVQCIPGRGLGQCVLVRCVPLLHVPAAVLSLGILYRANGLPGQQGEVLLPVLSGWRLNYSRLDVI